MLWISLLVIALFAGLGVTRAQTGTKADVVATITNLENDGVKADLAGDTAFYQKALAEDWTRGDSASGPDTSRRDSEDLRIGSGCRPD